MFEPRKRTAIDGKTWWCVYDISNNKWSTYTFFGRYKTKKACQNDIDYCVNKYQNFIKTT